jgi:cytochrome b561/polyisoprenoid-binding protein YceI
MSEASSASRRYTSVAIALHWLIAIGIVGMILFGWYMGDLPDGEQKYAFYQLHKSFGITILVLSVARIVWRLMNPPPAEPPMPGWQSLSAKAVHVIFYGLIILMPLTGWMLASASPTGIETKIFGTIPWPHLPGLSTLPADTKAALAGEDGVIEFAHSKLAWVALVLLALHVGAALKHQFIDKDGLMARMAPGLFGRTAGPVAPGRGALIAFGAGVAFFAAVAGFGQLSTAGAAPPSAAPTTLQSNAPAWEVDTAASAIIFKGAYMGRPFEGRFNRWTADIRFDPADPAATRVRVDIDMTSAATGEMYYDSNVQEGDWFDSRQFTNAIFEINEGVAHLGDNRYEATGVLTIKGKPTPVRLPFTLDVSGATARMQADINLQRLALGVGAATKSAPSGDEEWVADDVGVVIDVSAARK